MPFSPWPLTQSTGGPCQESLSGTGWHPSPPCRAPKHPPHAFQHTNEGQRNEANLHTDVHVFTYANEAQLNIQIMQLCKWGTLGYAEGDILFLFLVVFTGFYRASSNILCKALTGTYQRLSLMAVSGATFHRRLSQLLPSCIIPILRQQKEQLTPCSNCLEFLISLGNTQWWTSPPPPNTHLKKKQNKPNKNVPSLQYDKTVLFPDKDPTSLSLQHT